MNRPASMASVTARVAKLTMRASRVPLKTINITESITVDSRYPEGLRYLSACAFLVTLASFRFKSTTQITDLHYDVNSISGICVPSKPNKSPFTRDVPADGFVTQWGAVSYNCRSAESTSRLYMSRYGLAVFDTQQRLVDG